MSGKTGAPAKCAEGINGVILVGRSLRTRRALTGTMRILRVAAARGSQPLRHHLPTGTSLAGRVATCCDQREGRAPARPPAREPPMRKRVRSRRCRNGQDARCPNAASRGRARPPDAPRHWHFIGFAFGMCAAVLQCAPRARTQGREKLRTRQSASKNISAQQKALQKAQPTTSNFFQLFLKTPLRARRRCDTLAAVQRPD